MGKVARRKRAQVVGIDHVEDSGKGSRPLGSAMSDREGETVSIDIAQEGGLLDSLTLLGIPDADPQRLAVFFAPNDDEFGFDVYRTRPEENATFSEDAMTTLRNNLIQYIMARIYSRWARTGEAPTFLRVIIKLEWEK